MAQHNKQNKVATIKSFRIERISLSGGRIQPKLILGVETEKQQTFEISEAIIDKDGTETCQGLWLNMDKDGKVAKKSTLNTLLKFFNVRVLMTFWKRKLIYDRTLSNTSQYIVSN